MTLAILTLTIFAALQLALTLVPLLAMAACSPESGTSAAPSSTPRSPEADAKMDPETRHKARTITAAGAASGARDPVCRTARS